MPAQILLLFTTNKITVFYGVRVFLALACAAAECYLVCAARRQYGRRIALTTAFFLLLSPGMFLAAPTLLPSTFTMLALTVCMASWLDGQHNVALAAATVGTFVSCWPYVAVCFVPVGLDALARRPVHAVIAWCVFLVVVVNMPLMAIDAHYYGKFLYAPWNIVAYNVFNAKAHLYGVEGWQYYLKNCVLNFSIVFPLALMAVCVPVWRGLRLWRRAEAATRQSTAEGKVVERKPILEKDAPGPYTTKRLVLLAAHMMPMYLWGAVMQSRPHKEERFVYVVYPLICFSAAITLDALLDVVAALLDYAASCCGADISQASSSAYAPASSRTSASSAPPSPRRKTKMTSGSASKTTLGVASSWLVGFAVFAIYAVLSASRIASNVRNFRAPMEIFRHLYDVELPRRHGGLAKFHHKSVVEHKTYRHEYFDPERDQGDHVLICVGKEWYRFPSSFFLRPWARLAFLRSGFRGQLPKPFAEHVHGTRLPVTHMNDENAEETSRYVKSAEAECHYIVDLDLGPGSENERDPRYTSIEHAASWEVVKRVPFLDAARSPSLTRALYIPGGYSDEHNTFASYVLLRNRRAPAARVSKEVIVGADGGIVGGEETSLEEEQSAAGHAHAGSGGIGWKLGAAHDLSKVFPDIVDLSTAVPAVMTAAAAAIPRVVYTKPGRRGFWNRDMAKEFRHLLFVYGENHRDYLAMDAYLHPVSGQFASDKGERKPASHEGIHVQTKTQANIRGEPNAFPVRTVWYHSLPESHGYRNFMSDDDYHENVLVIHHDVDTILEAWHSGMYSTLVLPRDGLGTGVARLPKRAPRTYAFLEEEMARLIKAVEAADDHEALREKHSEEVEKRGRAARENQHMTLPDEL